MKVRLKFYKLNKRGQWKVVDVQTRDIDDTWNIEDYCVHTLRHELGCTPHTLNCFRRNFYYDSYGTNPGGVQLRIKVYIYQHNFRMYLKNNTVLCETNRKRIDTALYELHKALTATDLNQWKEFLTIFPKSMTLAEIMDLYSNMEQLRDPYDMEV